MAQPDQRKEHNANEADQRNNRRNEQPERAKPEPDTVEGPGGKRESKAEQDAANKTTRRGER